MATGRLKTCLCGGAMVLCLLLASCKPKQSSVDQSKEKHSTPVNLAIAATTPALPENPPELWNEFDGEHALQYARKLCELGPRPSGSQALDLARKYVSDQLSSFGWQVLPQRFTDRTPGGKSIEFCNLLAQPAQLKPAGSRTALVAYLDSPHSEVFHSVGASDGAANSAILIELARVLAKAPRIASAVELVFLDGHAPFRQTGLDDGLFGSRFFTELLKINRQVGSYQAAVVLANQGGPQPRLCCARNSNPVLIKAFREAAQSLDFRLEISGRPLLSDHVPFSQARIPALALLDPDSPVLETADDGPDRLSAVSLAQSGKLVLYYLASLQAAAH